MFLIGYYPTTFAIIFLFIYNLPDRSKRRKFMYTVNLSFIVIKTQNINNAGLKRILISQKNHNKPLTSTSQSSVNCHGSEKYQLVRHIRV